MADLERVFAFASYSATTAEGAKFQIKQRPSNCATVRTKGWLSPKVKPTALWTTNAESERDK